MCKLLSEKKGELIIAHRAHKKKLEELVEELEELTEELEELTG
jgi:hypothetical protein